MIMNGTSWYHLVFYSGKGARAGQSQIGARVGQPQIGGGTCGSNPDCGHAQVKSESGVYAGQTRIRNMAGLNPDRERGRVKPRSGTRAGQTQIGAACGDLNPVCAVTSACGTWRAFYAGAVKMFSFHKQWF